MNKKFMLHLASFAVIATFLVVPTVVFGQWDPSRANGAGANLPEKSIADIVKNIMTYLLYLIGFLGVIGFVISGVLYLVSAGNEGMIDRAKSAMINSIIGIIVALVGLIIIRAVDSLLRANNNSI